MAKIKGWKKVSETRWKNEKPNGLDIEVMQNPKNKKWAVFKVLGDKNFGYLDWKQISIEFSNKKTAIDYAISIMERRYYG